MTFSVTRRVPRARNRPNTKMRFRWGKLTVLPDLRDRYAANEEGGERERGS